MLCFACNFPLWLDNSKIVPSFLCLLTSPLSLSLSSKNASFRETFSDSSREIWYPVAHLEITLSTLSVTISLYSGSSVDSEIERQEHPSHHGEGIQSILTDLISKHSQVRSPFSISWHLSSSLQLLYHVPHLSLFIPKCSLGSEEWTLAFAGSPCQTLSFQNSLSSTLFQSVQLRPFSLYTQSRVLGYHFDWWYTSLCAVFYNLHNTISMS